MSSPRPPVRSVALAVASVSCSNSACVGLHRRARQVVPIVHQHGCSQVSPDLALTREILAGLMANPNVARSVVIGLGCEANQADQLAERARERGGSVAVVGIQSSGGVDEAIAAALEQLDSAPAQGTLRQLPVRVGVMADESSGEAGAGIAAAVADELAGHGLTVVISSPAALPEAVNRGPARGRRGAGGVAQWAQRRTHGGGRDRRAGSDRGRGVRGVDRRGAADGAGRVRS